MTENTRDKMEQTSLTTSDKPTAKHAFIPLHTPHHHHHHSHETDNHRDDSPSPQQPLPLISTRNTTTNNNNNDNTTTAMETAVDRPPERRHSEYWNSTFATDDLHGDLSKDVIAYYNRRMSFPPSQSTSTSSGEGYASGRGGGRGGGSYYGSADKSFSSISGVHADGLLPHKFTPFLSPAFWQSPVASSVLFPALPSRAASVMHQRPSAESSLGFGQPLSFDEQFEQLKMLLGKSRKRNSSDGSDAKDYSIAGNRTGSPEALTRRGTGDGSCGIKSSARGIRSPTSPKPESSRHEDFLNSSSGDDRDHFLSRGSILRRNFPKNSRSTKEEDAEEEMDTCQGGADSEADEPTATGKEREREGEMERRQRLTKTSRASPPADPARAQRYQQPFPPSSPDSPSSPRLSSSSSSSPSSPPLPPSSITPSSTSSMPFASLVMPLSPAGSAAAAAAAARDSFLTHMSALRSVIPSASAGTHPPSHLLHHHHHPHPHPSQLYPYVPTSSFAALAGSSSASGLRGGFPAAPSPILSVAPQVAGGGGGGGGGLLHAILGPGAGASGGGGGGGGQPRMGGGSASAAATAAAAAAAAGLGFYPPGLVLGGGGGVVPLVPGGGRRASLDKPPALKKYKCDVCDKAFSRSNTLVTHKRIHTGDKPFKCERCGRAFRQPGNLTRHRLTHTTHKPHVCSHCGKAFNRASNLSTHMRTHTNVRIFPCTSCPKQFSHKNDLRLHLYTCNHSESQASLSSVPMLRH